MTSRGPFRPKTFYDSMISVNKEQYAAAHILSFHRYHVLISNFHGFNTARHSSVCKLKRLKFGKTRKLNKIIKYKLLYQLYINMTLTEVE